jgi:hypothetical protein
MTQTPPCNHLKVNRQTFHEVSIGTAATGPAGAHLSSSAVAPGGGDGTKSSDSQSLCRHWIDRERQWRRDDQHGIDAVYGYAHPVSGEETQGSGKRGQTCYRREAFALLPSVQRITPLAGRTTLLLWVRTRIIPDKCLWSVRHLGWKASQRGTRVFQRFNIGDTQTYARSRSLRTHVRMSVMRYWYNMRAIVE